MGTHGSAKMTGKYVLFIFQISALCMHLLIGIFTLQNYRFLHKAFLKKF